MTSLNQINGYGSGYGTVPGYGSVNASSGTTAEGDAGTATPSPQAGNPPAATDRVTLSPGARQAEFRDLLGLSPTAPAKRSDLAAVAEKDLEAVSAHVKETLKSLGIGGEEAFSLQLGDNGKIVVSGDFEGNDALSQTLNSDRSFTKSFARLSINTELLTYSDGLRSTSAGMSAATILGGQAGDIDNTLMQIAEQYNDLKSMARNDPLEAMVNLSLRGDNRFILKFEAKQ